MLSVSCGLFLVIFFLWVLEARFVEIHSLNSNNQDVKRQNLKFQDTFSEGVKLTREENEANAVIMKAKLKELGVELSNVSKIHSRMKDLKSHFFLRKAAIDVSPVFNMIKRMPKGAVLNVHETTLINRDYLIKNITYRDSLYICIQKHNGVRFKFSENVPHSTFCKWDSVTELRIASKDAYTFDSVLADFFTLNYDSSIDKISTSETRSMFTEVIETISSIIFYKQVYEDYIYEALRQYREDNVFYLEIKTGLYLYDMEGNLYDPVECARILKRVNDKFVTDYPDSFGFRIIYAPFWPHRQTMEQDYVQIAERVKEELGDFMAGFDLVGQEELGKPLKVFLKEIVNLPKKNNLFYHSLETDAFKNNVSRNDLIDAVLLGIKRVGFSKTLLQHPIVRNIIKSQGIALEVNPVSYQVMFVIDNLNDHPARFVLAENYPVVISSDNPGIWGTTPLSHDMYEAFVGLTGQESDMRTLKQWAVNSIYYSSMPIREKESAFIQLNYLWDDFIKDIKTSDNGCSRNKCDGDLITVPIPPELWGESTFMCIDASVGCLFC